MKEEIKKMIKFTKTESNSISQNGKCTIYLSPNYAEIVSTTREPKPFNYKRQPGNKYLNTKTGETFEFSKEVTDEKIRDSRRHTFKRFELLTRINFTGGHSEVFVTLGYDYIMSDIKRFNENFTSFCRKIKKKFNGCKYIAIVEYKGNKSLHVHMLIKSAENKRLFLDRDELIKLWGQKSVYIKRIPTTSDVERLIKYLNPFSNKNKQERLKWYNKNFNIFRHSQNIEKPKVLKDSVSNAWELMREYNFKIYEICSFSVIGQLDDGTEIKLNNIQKMKFTK